ncbi:MAG: hypothetical protein LBL79_00900 [Prevotella sp.]|jgi:hypothetical protein|nr:hypothetical protein [Prevotella sp.]
MKPFFYAILLLTVFFFTFSCKTKRSQVMKERYRTAKKHSVLENKLLGDNNSLLLGNSTPQDNNNGYNNSGLQSHSGQANSVEFNVLFDDSEIANGNVYREAAAHRQKLIDDCNCGETKTSVVDPVTILPTPEIPATTNPTESGEVATAALPSTPQEPEADVNQTPAIFAHLLDAEKKPIRRVRVRLINENDQYLLKQYSVIIAALSKPAGVERLKKAFATSSDQIFFVRNELGLYYAIIGSYDAEYQAVEKIRRVYMEYTNLYTTEQLMNKYGITFTDLWILRRKGE